MNRYGFLDNVKVNLETMTRCGGSCAGCMLIQDERRHGSLWPLKRLANLTPLVAGFISGQLEQFDPLEVSINCGQGDHLLASAGELTDLVSWISRVGAGRAIGFLTASAVGRSDRVRRSVDAIREASIRFNQPIMLDMVFDPVKSTLASFRDTYAENIDYIREAFGAVDFTVNIGPDTIATVTPSDLHDFIKASGIPRFTMNFVPTRHSAPVFIPIWHEIMEWSGEVLRLWNPADGYEINLGQAVSVAMASAEGLDTEGPDELARLVALSASRSLYIDHEDWIWHSQEGFGDIAFSRRVGWSPTIDIAKDIDTSEEALVAVEASARRFTTRLLSRFHADPICSTCRFSNVCSRIGAGAIRSAIGERAITGSDRCPIGLISLLEIFEEFTRDGTLEARMCRKDFTHLPIGFDSETRPRAMPIATTTRRLDLDSLVPKETA